MRPLRDEANLNLHVGAAQDRIKLANREKIPCRTSALRGDMYAQELRNGSPVRFREVCRMDKHTFRSLMVHLEPYLEDTIHITANEQVMIFLFIIGHAGSNRLAGERFQHSGETISRYYNLVLKALASLESQLIVQPHPGNPCPGSIRTSQMFYPWFEGCVGVINGTQIQADIPEANKPRYDNHKGNNTQNVLAGCDF